jgi:hypothetical protein
MSALSSERPHDQGIEHGMANNRWKDAPALPAAQTIDNASNDRQRQIDSAASMSNCKYERYAEHDQSLKSSLRVQPSTYNEKAVIHQAAKEELFCYWRDEYRPEHFSCRHLSVDGQVPILHTDPEQREEGDRRKRCPLNCSAIYTPQRQDQSLVRAADLPSEFPKSNCEQPYDPPIGNSHTHHCEAPRRQPRNWQPLPPPFRPERLRNDYF